MGQVQKLLRRVLSGRSDASIAFHELTGLLERLGFQRRSKGNHHVFTRPDIEERIDLQADGPNAKRYQAKQVRDILTKYGLGDEDDG